MLSVSAEVFPLYSNWLPPAVTCTLCTLVLLGHKDDTNRTYNIFLSLGMAASLTEKIVLVPFDICVPTPQVKHPRSLANPRSQPFLPGPLMRWQYSGTFPYAWSTTTFACRGVARGTSEVWHIWCNQSEYLCTRSCAGALMVVLIPATVHALVSSSSGIKCGGLLGKGGSIVPTRRLLVHFGATLDSAVVAGGTRCYPDATLDSAVVVVKMLIFITDLNWTC